MSEAGAKRRTERKSSAASDILQTKAPSPRVSREIVSDEAAGEAQPSVLEVMRVAHGVNTAASLIQRRSGLLGRRRNRSQSMKPQETDAVTQTWQAEVGGARTDIQGAVCVPPDDEKALRLLGDYVQSPSHDAARPRVEPTGVSADAAVVFRIRGRRRHVRDGRAARCRGS